MDFQEFFQNNDWKIAHTFTIPEKPGEYENHKTLNLSEATLNLLNDFTSGIYKHQQLAISSFLAGQNVCISTSTASGKTLVFQICAIETLIKEPSSKILAIYPLRALGSEQETRWRQAIKKTGLSNRVGRIDGGVPILQRVKILKSSSILVITPDIIHAWLLYNLRDQDVYQFIKNISLIVIDEAHVYSGVFGSNSAFLFRRLHHFITKLGGKTRLIAASATIEAPEQHLKNLTGMESLVIDSKNESSPKKALDIYLVDKPESSDYLRTLSSLMRFLVNQTEHKFVVFVDSRKQTEYLASISSVKYELEDGREILEELGSLQNLHIYPYRSGYEESDRKKIQQKLTTGQLRGVISTSALEMGIDIPYLTLGILWGIPHSAASFYQRLGRVGRHHKGVAIIINNGSINTEIIFRQPDKLFSMPLPESTLYLENHRIQYLHALCLARVRGEDDTVNAILESEEEAFSSQVEFPKNFISLCNSERIGDISAEFQSMKTQARDDPNHVFPLRDIEVQYQVEYKQGPHIRRLGSLSYSQMMREAYPGAVYYYQTQTFRVFRINFFKKRIEVRQDRKYKTKPTWLPTLIFPNLSEGNILQGFKYEDLVVLECHVQIREAIAGFTETRGKTEINVTYPLSKSLGLYFEASRFTRNYFTTGIIINHPKLDEGVKCSLLAKIVFEAFLMTIPFDKQDVHFGDDKHRTERTRFNKGSRFLSIYDQTYGSLRLTSRLMEFNTLKKVLGYAVEIAENDERFELSGEEKNALSIIYTSLQQNEPEDITLHEAVVKEIADNIEKIVQPGSVGLNIQDDKNEEFWVEEIFYHPDAGLMYKGKALYQQSKKASATMVLVPVGYIKEVPGESEVGYYNYETGEIEPG